MSTIERFEDLLIAEKRKNYHKERHRNQRRRTSMFTTQSPDDSDALFCTEDYGSPDIQPSMPIDESAVSDPCDEAEDSSVHDALCSEEVLSSDDVTIEDMTSSTGIHDNLPSRPIHFYTELTTTEFCRSLLLFIRKSNICKTHVKNLLHLLHSVFPQPNFLPRSLNDLVQEVSGISKYARETLHAL